MKIEKRPNWLLNYEDMNTLPIEIKVPLLIDENNNVLLGNSLKKYLESLSDVDCIVIGDDLAFHLKKWLRDLELYLIEENNLKRYHDIESEIQNLLKISESIQDSNINLFSLEREVRTILDVEFDKPGKFKFKKGRKKEEEDDNLFSSLGE